MISFLFIGIAFGSSSIAFIYVSSSISLKTFYAEAKDLLISGPNWFAYPIAHDALNIANIATNIYVPSSEGLWYYNSAAQ